MGPNATRQVTVSAGASRTDWVKGPQVQSCRPLPARRARPLDGYALLSLLGDYLGDYGSESKIWFIAVALVSGVGVAVGEPLSGIYQLRR
jgi:hypothetical protein